MDILEEFLHGKNPVMSAAEGCGDLLLDCDSAELACQRLPLALARVQNNPAKEQPQLTAVRLLELTRRRENMLDTWAAFSRRFPDNLLATRMHMRWLRRENRPAEGVALLDGRFPGGADVRQAELFAELGEHAAADRQFSELLDADPADAKTRLIWVKLLQSRGATERACAILQPIRASGRHSPTARSMIAKLDAAVEAQKSVSAALLATYSLASAALHQSIMAFSNREVPRSASPHLGGVSFVTGTLGAGGAERQMSRLACAMHACRESAQPIAGIRLQAPIEMVITNVSAAAGNDFFLPDVRRAGISLTVISDLEPEPLGEIGLPAGIVTTLAPVLPKNALFGLQRLVAHFRRVKPEVAYIWQDGAVLIAALAALVAQVPRVVISVRGMPPNLRQNLNKDEFLGMYQALARVPGVALTSNSRAAADAYADWIGLPKTAFTIIYNAVDIEKATGDERDQSLWRAFVNDTGAASFTLGGVFRFADNKRPLKWIEFAASAAKKHRSLRLILVGSGALLDQARKRADDLGIADRILFVGHSRSVGYWLSKMDAVALLSEHEGLPNVLIEAQLAGLPVISTPAGGATETFIPAITGMVLDSAETPCATDFLMCLEYLMAEPERTRLMGKVAREAALHKFALSSILEQTTRYFKGHLAGSAIEPASRPTSLSA